MCSRLVTRLALSVAVGAIVSAAVAAAAWAHVEVSADKPQAGATNVTLSFTGEAESSTAGIAAERVYLPAGITPQQVRLDTAPNSWTFRAEADGFTVAGPPLPVGTAAEFSVVVAQLPNATELIFKTIETYGDGSISRWISEQQPGQPEPEDPAPVLKLAPAPGATARSAAAAAPSTQPDTTSAASTSTGGGGNSWWIVAVIVVAALAVVTAVVLRRRRTPPTN